MNRLKDLSCYLSGPIDFVDDMGHGWRDEVTPFLDAMNVRVFNPLKHSFYGSEDVETIKRPKMMKLLEGGKFEEHRNEMKDLNHWDLRSVDLSSFLIVNYDNSIHMCGTYEEIFTANKQHKPVLLVLSCPKNEISSWMHGRFPPSHMFDSWESLYSYLTNINSDPNYKFTEADNKRWLFFDGPHMCDISDYLLDCPFCGGRPVITPEKHPLYQTVWRGWCKDCDTLGPAAITNEKDAILFWNERYMT